MTHHHPVLNALFVALLLLLPLSSASAQDRYDPGSEGAADIGGGVNSAFTERDNTRVMGTVRDAFGNPINEIEIRVRNNDAPANELIFRTRKTGTYLVRDVSRLWSLENVTGITLRLRFEAVGLEPFETTVGVAKNGLAELHPILWEPGEEKKLGGWCVIVQGDVTDSKGKKLKKGSIVFTSKENPEFRVETEVSKGHYEALLWAAPADVSLTLTADGEPPLNDGINFGTDMVTDRVRVALKDLVLP